MLNSDLPVKSYKNVLEWSQKEKCINFVKQNPWTEIVNNTRKQALCNIENKYDSEYVQYFYRNQWLFQHVLVFCAIVY